MHLSTDYTLQNKLFRLSHFTQSKLIAKWVSLGTPFVITHFVKGFFLWLCHSVARVFTRAKGGGSVHYSVDKMITSNCNSNIK